MDSYKILKQQVFTIREYSIVPIRYKDRINIMKWRNEQMYHLRQSEPLTEASQNNYFDNVVKQLFNEERPKQILFSFLKNEECIGYGGLVHINHVDRNAEISFIMDTSLEDNYFSLNWNIFLNLIEVVAFQEIDMHKIFTYAFDIRSHLYEAIEKNGYQQEAILKQHVFYDERYIDVFVHCKFKNELIMEQAKLTDLECTYNWVLDTKIRQFSFSKDVITFNHHKKWFLEKVSSENCNYYIAVRGSKRIGSIRFDIVDSSATLSYLVDSSLHGKGFGKTILAEGIQRFSKDRPDINIVKGLVMIENKASIKIFESLNFENEINETGLVFYKRING